MPRVAGKISQGFPHHITHRGVRCGQVFFKQWGDEKYRVPALPVYAMFILIIVMHLSPAHAGECVQRPITIRGTSMTPHIKDGAVVTVKQGKAQCIFPVAHGEVVLFQSDSMNIPLIKAVRGMPGDIFAVCDGNIIINGTVLTNSEGVAYQLSPARAAMIELYVHDFHGVIPSDLFLVMGENPAGTTDSSRFGLVPRANIIGKIIEK